MLICGMSHVEFGSDVSALGGKAGACATHQWSAWSPCSVTCGLGTRVRQRGYVHAARGADSCRLELTQRELCQGPRRDCRYAGCGRHASAIGSFVSSIILAPQSQSLYYLVFPRQSSLGVRAGPGAVARPVRRVSVVGLVSVRGLRRARAQPALHRAARRQALPHRPPPAHRARPGRAVRGGALREVRTRLL